MEHEGVMGLSLGLGLDSGLWFSFALAGAPSVQAAPEGLAITAQTHLST
ncbi:hypothetical protein [Paenibacillus pseudetheri]|nr:hypothetical protein [Paenibacillus pseudetheri]